MADTDQGRYKVRYSNGGYVVIVLWSLACPSCSKRWRDGELSRGTACNEPEEAFAVGMIGKRNGWYQIGCHTENYLAAKTLCDALAQFQKDARQTAAGRTGDR